MNTSYFVRLPLVNAYNVRDLGGYSTSIGRFTKGHTFVRADDPCNLEEEDINFLLDYGIKAIVDLRSEEELQRSPNPFATNRHVDYINIPLMIDSIDDVTKISSLNPTGFLTSFYIDIIKKAKNSIKKIFTFYGEHADGGVMYHCAAGKDRTGIISMLLLGLVGVDKYDIISNYEITYTNLRRNPNFMNNLDNYNVPMDLMYSKDNYIEPLIDYIIEEYGDFHSYLLSCGILEENLCKIKTMLTN